MSLFRIINCFDLIIIFEKSTKFSLFFFHFAQISVLQYNYTSKQKGISLCIINLLELNIIFENATKLSEDMRKLVCDIVSTLLGQAGIYLWHSYT